MERKEPQKISRDCSSALGWPVAGTTFDTWNYFVSQRSIFSRWLSLAGKVLILSGPRGRLLSDRDLA